MKRINDSQKRIGLILSLSIIASTLIPNLVFAESEIQLGEYMRLGSYNGSKIIWRYVGDDENGKLMLSDEIVCYKAFDAAGEHKNTAESRSSFGSNLWSESNIRCWLNSESEQVDYVCGNPPSAESVWMHLYPYDSEKGFLTGFSSDEQSAIKTVSIKTKLNPVDASLSEGELSFPKMESNGGMTMKTCDYQTTEDKIFLLDESQLYMVKENFSDDYYAKSDMMGNDDYIIEESNMADILFLRTPNTDETAADRVCNIRKADGEVLFDNTIQAYMVCGIRPALYLSEDVSFIRGNGTKEDPYIVSDNTIDTQKPEADTKKLLVVNADDGIKLYNGNNEILFDDAKPFIDNNDRTLIPVRTFSESLGYNVDYDNENRTVTITGNDRIIKLAIGDNDLTVNDEVTIMDTAAQIVNDSTYIPIRFVAEALGYIVDYSAPITGWSINENGEIVLNTENGIYDEIKDEH